MALPYESSGAGQEKEREKICDGAMKKALRMMLTSLQLVCSNPPKSFSRDIRRTTTLTRRVFWRIRVKPPRRRRRLRRRRRRGGLPPLG
jgi:hypothetical protein